MRVLQLAARMLSLERFALPLMQRLRDDGFDVEAIAQFDGTEERVREAGFPVHDWSAGHSLNPLRMVGARRQLRQFLRNRTFNIVHTHCSFGGIIANPVAHPLEPHVIYTQHGFYVHEGLNPLVRAAWLRLERVGLKHADHVLCVSCAEQQLARGVGAGPPEKFVHVPGAGIETSSFRLSVEERRSRRSAVRESLGLSQDEIVMLTVSRLTEDKGYREMIAATRILRNEGHRFVLLAAGSGKDEAAIRRAIAQEGVEDVFRLLGWRDDVADLYCAADIFVFASHREGLPIAPIEAMASGLPVVLSDIPGCREEVEDGESGLLFATGDAQGLAGALAKVLGEPDARAKLGSAAQQRAAAFDLERVLERQSALYREIAASL
ncbi:MAG: glycosyltransferase family 4 protein [Armatimonadota bacterium]|jgi:glycosyltransferase involved in cell wall biosynthesis